MKNLIALMLALLPMFLSSCATTPPPVYFHNPDKTALVIRSLNSNSCEMLKPAASAPAANEVILSKAQSLPQHQTAIVILENYSEPQIGELFRERSTPLFISLRRMNYEHIIFLRGSNVSDPDGLAILVEYH